MRTGIIAQKLGMSRVFTEQGDHVPVTVLKLEDCQVVATRTAEHDGYDAVQLGVGKAKVKNVNRAMRGHYAKAKVEPKRKLAEFRVSPDALLEVGSEIGAHHFVPGQMVDVVGTSIGKGFAGAMKRHNFAGLEASHGISVSHRSHGSTGNSQDPGKVFKGKKMAGHLGDTGVTVQNIEIVETNSDRGLILVKGGVPGSKGAYLLISDAKKHPRPEDAPYPAGLKGATATEAPDVEAAEAAPEGEPAPAETASEGAPAEEAEPETTASADQPAVAESAAEAEAKPEPDASGDKDEGSKE